MFVKKGGIGRNIDPMRLTEYKEKGYAAVGVDAAKEAPASNDTAKPIDFKKGWTKPKLQAYLMERGVAFDEAATNAVLVGLCETAYAAELEGKEGSQ